MRRKRSRRIEFIAFVVGVAMVIAILGYAMLRSYSERIRRQLFNASSTSLEDTYAEAILVFDELTTSRWNYLSQMALYVDAVDPGEPGGEALARDYVERLQELYGYTDFYLLNESGQYMTVDGTIGYIDLGDALFDLIDNGKNIVTDGSLPGRENMFFYAVPAREHSYRGFSYCAVAFGYDKQDLSSAMALTAYNGESDAYLVYPNGRVCITMGDVRYEIRNLLNTMQDTGVSEEDVTRVTQDLRDGTTDTITVTREGIDYYLSYQATGLSDWRLVSLTPVSVVDRDINIVRTSTTNMMLGLGTMLGILLVTVGVYWGWRNLHDMNSMLAEREMIFLTLSEHMDEIYLLYNDERNKVQYVSPNIERLLGLTPEDLYEVPGSMTRCVVEQEQWNDRSVLQMLAPGEMLHREYHMVHHVTGETRPFLMDLYRSDNPAHPHTLIMSLTDNTREYAVRREITAAMENARAANEAKTNFLSNMSHDIRTPMNAIIGFTTLLDRDADNPAQVHHYTERIRSSGNHLLGLIGDILDISKIEAGNVTLHQEETHIAEVAEQVMDLIRPQAEAKRQNLTVRIDIPTGEAVLVDRMRLVQILQNLLSNAVKYTQDGGDISLDILRDKDKDKDKDKSIYVPYRFIVRDNGMGMSEEFLQQIFQPFTRATDSTVNRIQGSGLGMSITKELLDLMGGSIRVESHLHEGSTFTVDLELRVAARGAILAGDTVSSNNVACSSASAADTMDVDSTSQASQAAEPASIEGLHILAAEDNELNAEILAELLDMEGADCTIVHNGQEAVEAYEAAVPGQYDLILMDVQMPVMDGYAATRVIRESIRNAEGADIPIIAMTANAFREDVQNALDAGMNAHLSKPMNIKALRDTACRLVEEYRNNHHA